MSESTDNTAQPLAVEKITDWQQRAAAYFNGEIGTEWRRAAYLLAVTGTPWLLAELAKVTAELNDRQADLDRARKERTWAKQERDSAKRYVDQVCARRDDVLSQRDTARREAEQAQAERDEACAFILDRHITREARDLVARLTADATPAAAPTTDEPLYVDFSWSATGSEQIAELSSDPDRPLFRLDVERLREFVGMAADTLDFLDECRLAAPLPVAAPDPVDDLDVHLAEQMTDPAFAAAYRAREAAGAGDGEQDATKLPFDVVRPEVFAPWEDDTPPAVAAPDADSGETQVTVTFTKPTVCGHGCTTWCTTGDACPLDAADSGETADGEAGRD